jgi:hypothetical protein
VRRRTNSLISAMATTGSSMPSSAWPRCAAASSASSLVANGPTSTRSRVTTYQRPRTNTIRSLREWRSGSSPLRLCDMMRSTLPRTVRRRCRVSVKVIQGNVTVRRGARFAVPRGSQMVRSLEQRALLRPWHWCQNGATSFSLWLYSRIHPILVSTTSCRPTSAFSRPNKLASNLSPVWRLTR